MIDPPCSLFGVLLVIRAILKETMRISSKLVNPSLLYDTLNYTQIKILYMFGVPGAIFKLSTGFVLNPLKIMELIDDLFNVLLTLNSNFNMFVTIQINNV